MVTIFNAFIRRRQKVSENAPAKKRNSHSHSFHCDRFFYFKMLLLSGLKRYMVQSTKLYSVSDLASVDSGAIVDYLNKIYQTFDKHIRACDICTGKGTIHSITIYKTL